MSEPFDDLSAFIRSRHLLPGDWTVYSVRLVGVNADTIGAPLPLEVTGARHAPVTRGSRKGQPNYRKRLDEPSTYVVLPGELSSGEGAP